MTYTNEQLQGFGARQLRALCRQLGMSGTHINERSKGENIAAILKAQEDGKEFPDKHDREEVPAPAPQPAPTPQDMEPKDAPQTPVPNPKKQDTTLEDFLKDSPAPDPMATMLAKSVLPIILPIVQDKAVDAAEVTRLAKAAVADVKPFVIRTPEGHKKDLGLQHKSFKQLLQCISAGVHVFMAGPAGSGKSRAAENAAEALERSFYYTPFSPQTTTTSLLGYMDAKGEYIPSAFRKAYEDGGVFLADEIDAANAAVLTSLNGAVSSQWGSFPDKMVRRHENFVLVAGANTWGKGADRIYVGRAQLDGATLNRFVYLEWNYDEKLELQISPNENWTRFVQGIRKAVYEIGERVVISPRQSLDGGALLSVGVNWKEVEKLTIWNAISREMRDKIERHIPQDTPRSL